LVGVFVVACGVIEGAQELVAADALGASVDEFVNEGADCVVVGNRKLVCVASHRNLHATQ